MTVPRAMIRNSVSDRALLEFGGVVTGDAIVPISLSKKRSIAQETKIASRFNLNYIPSLHRAVKANLHACESAAF